MSLDQDAAFLQTLPLFRHFGPDQTKLIAFNAERRRLPRGTTLFREGDKAGNAIVVVAGEIELFRTADGKEKMLERVGPGAVLGEAAVIVDTERGHDARAVTDAEVLAISRVVFRRVLEEYPETAQRILDIWTERLNATMGDLRKVAPRFAGPG